MPPAILAPTIEELASLSELCLRSKAVWGYSEEFLEARYAHLDADPVRRASERIRSQIAAAMGDAKSADDDGANVVQLRRG